MVCRRHVAPNRRATRPLNWRPGQTSKLDLLVGQLGRADLAETRWCRCESQRTRIARSESAVRIRFQSPVVSGCRATVRLYGPAYGDGGQKRVAEGAYTWLRNGLCKRSCY